MEATGAEDRSDIREAIAPKQSRSTSREEDGPAPSTTAKDATCPHSRVKAPRGPESGDKWRKYKGVSAVRETEAVDLFQGIGSMAIGGDQWLETL